MDWDDEDEATHIFDKAEGEAVTKAVPAPRPAAGMTPAPAPANQKATLLGMTAPLGQVAPPPAPSSRMPPPPPSVGGAFARASGIPAAAPGPAPMPMPPPPTINPMPSAAPTQQGLGTAGHGAPFGATMPLNQAQQMAYNQTAPMPMQRGSGMPMPPPQQYSQAPMPPPQQYSQAPMPSQAQDYPAPMPPPNRMEATALVRPQSSSKAGLWIALVLLVLVLAGGAAAFFLIPRTGKLIVNVSDAKGQSVPLVQIFVDGKKQCDTAPCIVDQVSSGSHVVKVVASGPNQPPDQIVNIEARKDTPVTFTLEGGGGKKGTGLKVAGNQTGVKLYVDDKEIGPLPQELTDLTPGDHKITLKGGDRYAPLEKSVLVAKDEIIDMGAMQLKVVKGKATITLATSGAKVYLVSGSDRRELPSLPISVDIDTSKSWSLEASKTGYNDYKQQIGFDDGQAEKTFNVELTLKGQAPPPTATTAPTAPPTTPPTTLPVAPTTPPTTPTAPATAPPAGDAFLNINSIPPSSCFLDGVPLGMTPKIKTPVKPGAHRVKFMHPELGQKEVPVNVGAGETKPVFVKLQQ